VRTRITDKLLQAIKPGHALVPPEGKRARIWDATKDFNDFGVRITSKAAVSFFVTRRIKGDGKSQPITVVLGSYPATSLAAARVEATKVLSHLKEGRDPREVAKEEKRAKQAKARAEAARQANAFAQVAETFISRYVMPRMRTASAVAQLVRREFVSRWGDRPITEITRADIINLVEEIGERSPSAAAQNLTYVRLLFDWAIERDIYGVAQSPCYPIKIARLIPNMPGARDRVLSDDELRLVWKAAWPAGDHEDNYPTGQYVRLLLILGCRRSELSEMAWPEVDLDKATWTLKGERTKNGDLRLVPLPRLAVDMLAAMPRFTGPCAFTNSFGKRPILGFGALKTMLDRRIAKLNGGEQIERWTLHDLRRTMRTRLSAIPSISPLVAELMIGHRQGGVQAVYNLHGYEEEQRIGFELWCARLAAIVDPPAETNVVPMVAAR
jgi:integrase